MTDSPRMAIQNLRFVEEKDDFGELHEYVVCDCPICADELKLDSDEDFFQNNYSCDHFVFACILDAGDVYAVFSEDNVEKLFLPPELEERVNIIDI